MHPFYNNNHNEAQHNSFSNAIPSDATMKQRWKRRSKILEETKDHLLSHPHHAMSDTGRNIAAVLHDREKYGPQAIIRLCQFQRYRQNQADDSPSSPSRIELCRISLGDRSPSTVLESPVHRRETLTSDMEIVSDIDSSLLPSTLDDNLHPPQQQSHHSSINHVPNDMTTKTSMMTSHLRRVTYPNSIANEIRMFGEYCAATKYHSAFLTHLGGDDPLDNDGNLPPSSRAVSTISVAFAHDGHTMASTHGDHTVKISCCSTGRLLQSLDGHPRTPWTVKYHPTDARILASGCLGHQVRVWNWETKTCLQMIRLECAIISLSFHPSGNVLAIANGSRLHFWGINDIESVPHQQSAPASSQGGTSSLSATGAVSEGTTRSALLTEMDQKHMLRCVHFPPDGKTLIIGGVNPMTDDSRRPLAGGGPIAGGSMSFYLRLWDFNIEKSLEVTSSLPDATFSRPGVLDGVVVPTARRAISNVRFCGKSAINRCECCAVLTFSLFDITQPRTFVPRALLYNDGGFDLNVSGNVLCVCAELFLPDGVNNAMELLHKEQWAYESQNQDEVLTEKKDMMLPDILQDDSDAVLANAISLTETQPNMLDVPAVLNNPDNVSSSGRSVSFREGMEENVTGIRVPRTPNNSSPERHTVQHSQESLVPITGFIPMTPPVSAEPRFRNLSPPPPPGSRFMGRGILRTRDVGSYGHGHSHYSTTHGGVPFRAGANRGLTTPPPTARMGMRPPHPLSVISSSSSHSSPNNDSFGMKGRYVPHVVTVSLDTSPIPEEIRDASIARGKPPGAVARGYRPRLGQLLEAYPLDASKASAVTCVKFSPSADFCLIGYGIRDPMAGGGSNFHPVTAVFRVRGGMDHVSTMLSGDDDVNIARFHPDSGHSFIYGTKQGRVRVLSPRPWNFYGDC